MERIQADAVLDLAAFADQPDVAHPSRASAEEGAAQDARYLEGATVFVRVSGCPTGDHVFDTPVRARVYNVDTDRWMDSDFLDPYVDFVFLDPVDPEVFEPDEDGKQYGWWYSRTHRLAP